MQVQYRYRTKIPLVGDGKRKFFPKLTKSEYRKSIAEAFRRSDAVAGVKPERFLGAPWIDNFVAQRGNVNLCEECWRRYNDWWKRYGYRPEWKPKLSDCDGCGHGPKYVTGFYPEERFSESMLYRR